MEKPDDQSECRVCFCAGGDLIAPCACRGDRLWVHRSRCLDEWRKSSEDNYLVCEVCLYPFQLEATPLYTEAAERRMTLRWYAVVAADTVFALAILVLLAAFIGAVVYQTDPDQSTSTLVFGQGALTATAAYFLIGCFWLCVMIGIVGMVCICCGADVKRPRRTYSYSNVFGPDPCCPTVYVCPRCDGCKGDCNGSGGDGEYVKLLVLVVVLLALIGFFLGLYLFFLFVSERIEAHARAIWRSDAVRTQRVKHLDVRPASLCSAPSTQSMGGHKDRDLEMATKPKPPKLHVTVLPCATEETGTLLGESCKSPNPSVELQLHPTPSAPTHPLSDEWEDM